MILYLEFHESQIGLRYNVSQRNIPAKYCTRNCSTDLAGGPLMPAGLVHRAQRVWLEDENGIKFIKNRHSNPETTPVDMKELMWIKLQAVTI